MKRVLLALLAGLLTLALIPDMAAASTYTVDQTNVVADTYVQDSGIDAQTFTAGLYGSMDSVELWLAATSASVHVTLQGTTGNPPVPDGNVHGSRTLGVTSPGGNWYRFVFTTNYIVIPGHVYAIVVLPTDNAQLWGSAANHYSRGRALTFSGGHWVAEPGVADFSFYSNVSVMTPPPTPRRSPTHAPTHAATPTPTPASAASPTSDPAAAASPAAVVAGASSAAASPDPAGAGAPAAGANGQLNSPGQGSGSGGSTGIPVALVGGGGVLLILLAGLVALALRRRRQPAS
jgi:hypothetical protein